MYLESEGWGKTLSFTFPCLTMNSGLALIDLDHVCKYPRLKNMASHDPGDPLKDSGLELNQIN